MQLTATNIFHITQKRPYARVVDWETSFKLQLGLFCQKARNTYNTIQFGLIHVTAWRNQSFYSCYKLSIALTVVTKYWQLLQAVDSFDSCYNCKHLWQLLKAVVSFDSNSKLLPAWTAVISPQQLWKLLQDVHSFCSCYKLLTALRAGKRCQKL